MRIQRQSQSLLNLVFHYSEKNASWTLLGGNDIQHKVSLRTNLRSAFHCLWCIEPALGNDDSKSSRYNQGSSRRFEACILCWSGGDCAVQYILSSWRNEVSIREWQSYDGMNATKRVIMEDIASLDSLHTVLKILSGKRFNTTEKASAWIAAASQFHPWKGKKYTNMVYHRKFYGSTRL